MVRACSIRMVIRIFWPTPFQTVSLMTHALAMSLPWSCMMVCNVCMWIRNVCSITWPWWTKTTNIPQCRKVQKKASNVVCICWKKTRKRRFSWWVQVWFCVKLSRLQKSCVRNIRFMPMSGAWPALMNWLAMVWHVRNITACIHWLKKRKSHGCLSSYVTRTVLWYRLPITCVPIANRSVPIFQIAVHS